ncbi:MAG: RagB/SusD family nutrient uptake outer membrane protein [Prevotellaceae bacterium]|jgi:hypothetical protein|nr:RagB/SusD family nutrient uptake outer membrane protein [Prevotellaceae bacterium]
MKIIHKLYLPLLIVGASLVAGCEVDDTIDPNAPSVEAVQKNASRTQINQLGVGLQASARNGLSSFYRVSGAIGRELYTLNLSDLTSTSELLGQGELSATTLFNGYYDAFSQTRRRAELFIQAATNTAANTLSDEEKAGIRGFANTIKAYAMLNTLNMQYKNGIRLYFTDLISPGDLLNPGPFGTYEQSLDTIRATLERAFADLQQAGASFSAFTVTRGYEGFNTPETFGKFNRGLAARTGIYQKDWQYVLTALQASFFDLSGDLKAGPVFTFSTASGDQANPLWQQLNSNDAPVVAQNNFVEEAEEGDTRVAEKLARRNEDRLFAGLTGKYDVNIYPAQSSPVSILRNEELILIYAEAKIHTQALADAVAALDKIRTAAGLQAIATAKPAIVTDKEALVDELLNQRRYSLYGEGHRWFDARRYDRLAQLPNDLPTHHVYEQMVRPYSEYQWDAKHPQ